MRAVPELLAASTLEARVAERRVAADELARRANVGLPRVTTWLAATAGDDVKTVLDWGGGISVALSGKARFPHSPPARPASPSCPPRLRRLEFVGALGAARAIV
jgi:hypothetical protein